MYIVKLSAKDGNEDYQFVNVEVKCNNKEIAIKKAIDYYYSEYWTNSDWKKEEFETDIINYKNKINELFNSSLLKNYSLRNIILNDFQYQYESYLRSYLGASDKSVEDFTKMSISFKIQYLSEIGCELSYFAYPKKTKFEKASI